MKDLTQEPAMMGAHCFGCKARFRIPCSPTEPLRCPECGSGQVIDHNLEPLTKEDLRALRIAGFEVGRTGFIPERKVRA